MKKKNIVRLESKYKITFDLLYDRRNEKMENEEIASFAYPKAGLPEPPSNLFPQAVTIASSNWEPLCEID